MRSRALSSPLGVLKQGDFREYWEGDVVKGGHARLFVNVPRRGGSEHLVLLRTHPREAPGKYSTTPMGEALVAATSILGARMSYDTGGRLRVFALEERG